MFENERFEVFLFTNPNLKIFSKRMFFLFRMKITSWRLGCLTLTICTMMNPLNTSLLIPLSSTLLMGFLSFSLPWWNSTSMFLTLLLFLTSKLNLNTTINHGFLRGSNWLTCHFLLMDMCIWLKVKALNDTCICWLINLTITIYLIRYTLSSCITLVKMTNGF